MTTRHGTKIEKRGGVLLGLAGGMMVVAGGMVAGYYVLSTRSVANAATAPAPHAPKEVAPQGAPLAAKDLAGVLARPVELVAGGQRVSVTWSDLGIEVDPDEAARAGGGDLNALAAKGSLPVRMNRELAVKKLTAIKAQVDMAATSAYLDLEARQITADAAGKGLDIYGSLPTLLAGARQAAPSVGLAMVAVPAAVTVDNLGIKDISNVLGHYETKFSVSDKDRNFNLKLAASKLNGVVLQPHVEWSFNDTVGERSQRMGYKVAHVISAGEMIDGLAGGTCQISTTLFGASFFAGLEIVKTTNHSRPSTYTPLAFDATVVWPDTDLKLMNPYDFPVAIHYIVANGEAKVEVLGQPRPYDKVVFERKVLEEVPFPSEERLDEAMPLDQTQLDQEGFPGYTLQRTRRFIKNGETVKTNKWTVTYKPVTEYIRRGTNPDPLAKMPPAKEPHSPPAVKDDSYSMAQ